MKFKNQVKKEKLIDQLLLEISQEELEQAEAMLQDDFTDKVMDEIMQAEHKKKYSKWGILTCYAACMTFIFMSILGKEITSPDLREEARPGPTIVYEIEENKISDFNKMIENKMSKFYRSFEKEVK